MDTRASTRTRLSVLPVFIALVFNLIAPVLSTAVPEIAPELLAPQVAEAASDPQHVSFTLQGCRNPSVNLEVTNFICADGDYTTGNLGKTWNELDLVPHRLTTSLGTQTAATETYTIGITADYKESGIPGYDVLGAPTINAGKSHSSCAIAVGSQQVLIPGIGGTDESLGRLLTISQNRGSTCVFDWVERLALGSSKFPGSSLHTNRTNQSWGTQGIGAADVSIPVKEILPQELEKDMSATRGQAYAWAVEKSADPSSLNFANTCLDTQGARSAQVQITVTWTRSGPTASGDTLITTNIYATNPAHRTITVDVTDRIYEGNTQTTQISSASSGAINVPAETADMLVLTHQFTYTGSATSFNDVATATYTDLVTGIPVPGQTTATASATTQPSTGPIANASVVVSDTESITGTGLSFSVAAPSVGAFTNYTAGSSATGPVNWQYTATNSGSVTLTKTVTVDEPRITSGSLSDTATIAGDNSSVLDSDSESVAISTDALVTLQINKTIPAGSLRSGESVTFNFDVSGPAAFTDTAAITFNHGDPLTKSTGLTDLAPGEYTVSEQAQANWATHTDQVDTITLPDCSGSVSFNNSTLAPDLSIDKVADNESVSAGEPIGFEITLNNSGETGTGIAKDVTLSDPLPTGGGIDWGLDSVTGTGGYAPAAGACEITGDPVAGQNLECDFGDLGPGKGVVIAVSSDTTAQSCAEYPNTATAEASNHAEVFSSDSAEVLCPDLAIAKTATTGTVNAGENLGFEITVSNSDADGTGTATNVMLSDPLPGSTALGVTWSIDAVLINGVTATDASDYCSITGSAPAQTLDCAFGDLEPGDEVVVQLSSSTSAPNGCETATLENEATANADNHAEIDADASITIECPDLAITKLADDDVVSAGQQIGFTVEVSNSSAAGVGTAIGVTISDALPGGDDVDWAVDGVWLNATAVGDPAAYCSIGGAPPAQTLTCDFGDLAPGETAAVHVTSNTTQDSCAMYGNVATVGADNHADIDSLRATTIVECPGLNIVKLADADPIDAGETASFTITIWNTGPGSAFDVSFNDELPSGISWSFELLDPDGDDACASSINSDGDQAISCQFGTLGVTDMAGGKVIVVSGQTDRDDCGVLENTAFADASNDEEKSSTDTITVRCPEITLEKENDAVGSVLPGTAVTYTLTLTVDDGPANDVTVVDALPAGLESPAGISNGGVFDATANTITWELGDLADGEYSLTYQATVADDVENGDELINAAAATSPNSQCPDLESLGPECVDDSTVIVRVPTLTIDKVADAEVITIEGEAGDLTATPSVITWTLSYTLANGPVTNAVISDELPVGLVYIAGSASDGGVFDDATNTLTWSFPTLSASGSVTFETTVDPETISRVAPTVNVAVIASDQTPEDEGQDEVSVVVEPPPLAGTPTPKPTPKPALPDTATGMGPNGEPITVPVELLVAFFIGSLGALTLANVKARSRRR